MINYPSVFLVLQHDVSSYSISCNILLIDNKRPGLIGSLLLPKSRYAVSPSFRQVTAMQ